MDLYIKKYLKTILQHNIKKIIELAILLLIGDGYLQQIFLC